MTRRRVAITGIGIVSGPFATVADASPVVLSSGAFGSVVDRTSTVVPVGALLIATVNTSTIFLGEGREPRVEKE